MTHLRRFRKSVLRRRYAMVAQLRAAAFAVEVDLGTYPNGRFARLHDPGQKSG